MGISDVRRGKVNGGEEVQCFAFVVAVFLCAAISVVFASTLFFGSRQGDGVVLESRINPNESSMGSLVRLPGIGIGRAGAIIAYRERFGGDGGGAVVFAAGSDLQKVKGIGPKTVERIGECLKFE